MTAPYKDNEGGSNFNLVRTLWYKFNDNNSNSYILLIDLFVDSSDIVDTHDQLIFNKYYLVFVILFILILSIFLAQINYEQMNINWHRLNIFWQRSTERIINRALDIIHGITNRN